MQNIDNQNTIIPNQAAQQSPVSKPQLPLVANKKIIIFACLLLVLIVVVGGLIVARKKGPGPQISRGRTIIEPNVKVIDREGTIELSPNKDSLKIGETRSVDILITSAGKSLDGVDIVLSYDPKVVDISFTEGGMFPLYPKKVVDKAEGKIMLTGITLEERPTPVTGSMKFGSLSITGKSEGETQVEILFKKGLKNESTIIENQTSDSLLGEVVSGTYTVTQ